MMFLSAIPILALVTSGYGNVWTAHKLKVGDLAPRLAFGECFKGHSLKKLQKGQIYVIDFWATGCVPCVASIPHLSELAKHYAGTVTVSGISVQKWANGLQNDTLKSVATFVRTPKGQAMHYNVFADTPDGFMAKHWLGAAGYDSIPACFVVGKSGRIAWMGRPNGLEQALKREVAGSATR